MEQVEATCFASAGRHGSIFGQSGLPKIRQAPPQKISCLADLRARVSTLKPPIMNYSMLMAARQKVPVQTSSAYSLEASVPNCLATRS